ncbi:wash complex subunit [Entamoeba histolytica]|uniref:Wash complex subunit n=2 Tax=Entamoeba TaxID=5758 RepID=A0A175JIC0_ENTHI|nr:wash complex subunit [Entamoeba histolytica]
MSIVFNSKLKSILIGGSVIIFFFYFIISLFIRPFAIPTLRLFLLPPQVGLSIPIIIFMFLVSITLFFAGNIYNKLLIERLKEEEKKKVK